MLPAATRPLRSVSVLMPTWQGAEFLERVLGVLARQDLELDWDFLAIDSGSSDGTLEILQRARARFPVPLEVERIHQEEFDHGDTRNLLAARSRGDLLVYLTQDAIPVGDDWLTRVVANFADPQVAAVTCRNVPRPDCDDVTRVVSATDPGYSDQRRETRLPPWEEYLAMTPEARRQLCLFNDVASAIRRELWELHPFPRTSFGEDMLMARALLEAGYTVVYDADAVVEHSHDYTPAESRSRAVIDGRFNVEWLDRLCIPTVQLGRAVAKRAAAADAETIRELGFEGTRARELQREAAALRDATFDGLYEGGQKSRGRREKSRLLKSAHLNVLLVVHGFPPDTWAGTEIYTLTLAKALVERGHRVTVLARVPDGRSEAQGGAPEFSVVEREFEGLRVLALTHRLQHRNLADSYSREQIESAFRKVLIDEQPDLVHFQHLIHLSAKLVGIAKELGFPTIVHCHDYWAVCARVQLIRPDGERCEENMGAGCLLCVKERHLDQIPRMKRLGRVFGGALDAFAERATRGKLGDRSLRRWEGYQDLRRRPEVVLGAYACADLLVSPSRFLRAKLLETGAFDKDRFVYSDNGLRTDHVEALKKQPDPQGRVRFGFVGTLVWYKGGETLVRAMSHLSGAAATLNVYGGFDPEHDEHHAQLQALAGDNVHFHGRFDNSKLSEVYAEIDVLIVPSVWFENSPITIHEAFLTKTPVIASDIGGMAEYVRDGVDGLHFKTGDDVDLARIMRRFVDEPGLAGQLSGDWMRIKTIAENAAETEFRYRALVAGRDRSKAAVVAEYVGIEAAKRIGPVDQQGTDMLLLRPGGAAVLFDLPVRRPGRHEVTVQIYALAAEKDTQLGGRLLAGERQFGDIEPFVAEGDTDFLRSFSFEVELEGPQTLRIDGARGHGVPDCFLRLATVTVRELDGERV
ncbi:2-deoxystreptamine glucosyltransferase [Planctomycetes bacterium Pla86]|uniref:2-deoxystreptamine glucosyltransferase n=1 Tax=Engelhardtia mirabilis TaxID=2528011 RepID=A0A518BJC5_9BACT|nr:2-deoxystreptamine glucosyltransferase [Planctomycetes bacterium Pla133]QDV01403.1 2-deoxystreptamine glucosyltransferase [Planctomycetes bacterium Pla86]